MTCVIDIRVYMAKRCTEVPMGERCTERLHRQTCPGSKNGFCASPNCDEKVHNPELPKFYKAQHE